MRTRRCKFIGVLGILVGWTSFVSASEPVVFIGSDTFETQVLTTNRNGCPMTTSFSTDDSGTGHASLLGSYSFTAGECINQTTLDISLGFFTVTAADGSTITGNYAGTGQYTDDAHMSILYAVSGFITEGTGRFKNVRTGTVTFLGGATFTSPTTATGFDTIFAGDLYIAGKSPRD